MSWSVYGMSNEVTMEMTEQGSLVIAGQGDNSVSLSPVSAGSSATTRIEQARVLWEVVPSNASEGDIDGTGLGLYRRIKAEPHKVHGMVMYSSVAKLEPSVILLNVALPTKYYRHAQHLFEIVIANQSFGWRMSFDFGFRVPDARTENLTVAGFFDGTPGFFQGLSIRIGVRKTQS